MIEFQVVNFHFGFLIREYENKASAFHYANRIHIPCYVRKFDSSSNKFEDLRFYF